MNSQQCATFIKQELKKDPGMGADELANALVKRAIRFRTQDNVAVVVVDILFLRYAYISFFCLLAGLGTLHLIYIIARNKCARECPVLFA